MNNLDGNSVDVEGTISVDEIDCGKNVSKVEPLTDITNSDQTSTSEYQLIGISTMMPSNVENLQSGSERTCMDMIQNLSSDVARYKEAYRLCTAEKELLGDEIKTLMTQREILQELVSKKLETSNQFSMGVLESKTASLQKELDEIGYILGKLISSRHSNIFSSLMTLNLFSFPLFSFRPGASTKLNVRRQHQSLRNC